MTEEIRPPLEKSQEVADDATVGAFITRGGADAGAPEFQRPAGWPRWRTGAEQPWDPEDLAVAEGRDPTPANIERARRELEKYGPAAIERTVP